MPEKYQHCWTKHDQNCYKVFQLSVMCDKIQRNFNSNIVKFTKLCSMCRKYSCTVSAMEGCVGNIPAQVSAMEGCVGNIPVQ